MKRLYLSILRSLAIVAAVTALFSCSKQDAEDVIPVLKMRDSENAAGGTVDVKVYSTGNWILEVEYEGAQKGWITLDKSSGMGNASVKMTVSANITDAPRAAVVSLLSGGYTVTRPFSQYGKNSSSLSWLELPALDQPKLAFFTHAMDGSAYVDRKTSGVRNWSFYYDYEAYVSWWVAYPLNTGLIGTGSRSDAWQDQDPLLPYESVCHLTSKYGGGWTRGHQIPSADRVASRDANITTFYPTNMTPQDYYFNGGDHFEGIWVRLEDQVRDYAKNCDTLYVVTGADVRTSTQWSGSNAGHKAKVPTAYYKALLRKKGSNYSAVGYYIPHSRSVYLDEISKYQCSIDKLEEQSGIDFFVNLVSALGEEKANAIEAADPATTLKDW